MSDVTYYIVQVESQLPGSPDIRGCGSLIGVICACADSIYYIQFLQRKRPALDLDGT